MNGFPNGHERRAHERMAMQLPIKASSGGDVFAGQSEDMSIGGAKIRWADERDLAIGDTIEVELALPGRPEPLRTDAEVRWLGGRSVCGIQFGARAQSVIAAFFAAACGMASSTASASATVPTFDPNADVVVEDTGPERPDEYEIQEAFFSQNEALDDCIDKASNHRKKQLEGDAQIEILLNPKGDRPLGVNASMPSGLARNVALTECVRRVVASAPYPAYDGPPVVVALSFELDPGVEYVEEDW